MPNKIIRASGNRYPGDYYCSVTEGGTSGNNSVTYDDTGGT